ncbi:UDP-glucose 6-dehydrogenase [bacterium]|nr:UDP-glucose 6-dehydrogenase [bacterium]MDP6571637.1 UDP-glucose/GDP-mannose dehydrogenase family protein [Patescibacteria group bacterium]|tara:strand:+ start:6486 stop:7781 length:1296 start_codon:yes stop_codon:yes gene_type:complete
MKLSIIGAGYVGLVTGASFAELGHDVTIMDIDDEKIRKLEKGIIPIHEPGLDRLIDKNSDRISFTTNMEQVVREADIHFICVWTPPLEDGSADLTAVRSVARELGKNFKKLKAKNQIVVTKSTVPVGTGKKIRALIRQTYKNEFSVVSNPEFLRESQAVADMMRPDRIIIGSNDNIAAQKVAEIYKDVKAPIIITDLATAEMIKYAANAFLATKISFINEVANVCDLVGADVEQVAEGIGSDKRIGKSFLKAGMGYGGSCFPKDVRALHQFSNDSGYDFKLLKSVIEVNEQQRNLIIDKLNKHLKIMNGKNILVLGLAFKAYTDDVRESVAIDVINRLQKEGANISAYDPLALINAQKHLGEDVIFVGKAYDGAQGADAIVIATEWPNFKDLDWPSIKDLMRKPLIIDGRNLLDPNEMRRMKFTYEGVGRG